MNDAVVTLIEIIISLNDRVRLANAEIERLKKQPAAEAGPRLVKPEEGA